MTVPATSAFPDASIMKGRVLIVDDVDENVDILRRQLLKNDFDIDVAYDGETALKQISIQRPDLVLLDLVMSGMSGMEVLKRIRTAYSSFHLPVIMISAVSEADSVIKAFELGASDYIVKPFNSKVVMARVRGQIERLQAIRALETLMAGAGERDGEAPLAEDGFAQAALVRDAIAARKASEASLRDALEKAEAASRAKRAFLSNMCHELRTPLNAIIGFSDILYGEISGEQADYIRHINKGGEHLLSILDALIRMSELERAPLVLKKARIGVRELIVDAVEILQHASRDKNLNILVDDDAEDMDLFADVAVVRQALINIVSNAVKFSPENGDINISFERRGSGRLAVLVEDRGVGFGEAELDELGEPFARGDFKYAGQYEGVGLGLPIAKRFIEAHDGEVRLENRRHGGARVIILLPLETDEQSSPAKLSGNAAF